MNEQQNEHDLVGAYVLDALSPEESTAFEAHLQTCAACRQEVAELRQVVDVLPLAVEPVEPPATLRDRIVAAVTAEEATPATRALEVLPGGAPKRRRARSPGIWLSAVAAVLIAALGLWNVHLQRQVHDMQATNTFQGDVIAALASGGQVMHMGGTGTGAAASAALVQPTNGRPAYLIVKGLPSAPSNKVYEAWFIRGGTPRAAGYFRPSGSSTVIVKLAGPATGNQLAAVTIEPGPRGGRAPTGPKVLVGNLGA